MHEDEVVLRVRSTNEHGYAKRVAGAMSWRLREDGFCRARAVKMEAVNTCVKALAIINQRVSRAGLIFAMDLSLEHIEPKDDKGGRASTVLSMMVQDAECARPDHLVIYRVSGKRSPDKNAVSSLAGALAAKAREGHAIRMRCIGPASVYKAVLAAAIAKDYVQYNHIEPIIVPSWDTMDRDGKQVSLIQVDFWAAIKKDIS